MTDIQRGGSGPYKFSNTVVHNGVVYLAGQVAGAEGFSQPVREQIRLAPTVEIDKFADSLQDRAVLTDLSKVDPALGLTKKERRFFEKLADVKRRLRYGFLQSLATPGSTARTVANFMQLTGDASSIDRTYATIEAVTVFGLRPSLSAAVAQRSISSGRCSSSLSVRSPSAGSRRPRLLR